MNKKKYFPFLTVIFIAVFVLFLILPCCGKYKGKMESISIAIPSSNGLFSYYIIGQEEHFFARNGLIVTKLDYQEGASALNDLMNGHVDIAAVTEYPVVGRAFKNDGVRIITNLGRGGTFFVISRIDRGINKIADLKGKRIGVALKTITEFYLGRFLNLNGMNNGDVSLVNTSFAQMEGALAGGSIDAAITREPYLSNIKKRLFANTVSWPAQNNQLTYSLMVSRDEWIARHTELVRRLLNSLNETEKYINKHPAKAKAKVQKILGFDDALFANYWQNLQFGMSLEQSMITAMEDEARWMISNKMTTVKKVPDFANFIYTDAMMKIKPAAVNFIR